MAAKFSLMYQDDKSTASQKLHRKNFYGFFFIAVFILFGLQSVHGRGVVTQRQLRDYTRGKKEVTKLLAALRRTNQFKYSIALMQRADSTHTSYSTYLMQILSADTATLFLPTDSAWSKLSRTRRNQLAKAKARSAVILLRTHTLKSRYTGGRLISYRPGTTFVTTAGSLLEKKTPPTRQKTKVTLGPPSWWSSVNRASISARDRYSSSLIIVHAVDNFIFPLRWPV